MAKNIYHKIIQIDSGMIDGNDHVNNVVYVEWMQEIATEHASTWGVDDLMDEEGTAWFARKHTIEYLRPIFLGDEIDAHTWISTVERVKSQRRYQFLRNGEVVAQGSTDWVYVDRSSGRPKPGSRCSHRPPMRPRCRLDSGRRHRALPTY